MLQSPEKTVSHLAKNRGVSTSPLQPITAASPQKGTVLGCAVRHGPRLLQTTPHPSQAYGHAIVLQVLSCLLVCLFPERDAREISQWGQSSRAATIPISRGRRQTGRVRRLVVSSSRRLDHDDATAHIKSDDLLLPLFEQCLRIASLATAPCRDGQEADEGQPRTTKSTTLLGSDKIWSDHGFGDRSWFRQTYSGARSGRWVES